MTREQAAHHISTVDIDFQLYVDGKITRLTATTAEAATLGTILNELNKGQAEIELMPVNPDEWLGWDVDEVMESAGE